MAQQQMEESLQRFLHTSLPRNVKTDVTTILKDAECQDNTDRYWNRSGKAGGYVEDIPAFKSDLYDGKGISYWNSEPENNRMLVWQETQPIRPGKYRFTAYAPEAHGATGTSIRATTGDYTSSSTNKAWKLPRRPSEFTPWKQKFHRMKRI